jgi:hypothetical protein
MKDSAAKRRKRHGSRERKREKLPNDKLWDAFVKGLDLFTDGFMSDRNQPAVQTLKKLR